MMHARYYGITMSALPANVTKKINLKVATKTTECREVSSYGDRTFAAAGPGLWNSLPVQLRNPDITYRLFPRQL